MEDKTPLQVCLDNKRNDWESVVEKLKDACPIPSHSESVPSKVKSGYVYLSSFL